MMMVNLKWLAKRKTIVLALIATKLITLVLVHPKWHFAVNDIYSAYIVTHKLTLSESQLVLEEYFKPRLIVPRHILPAQSLSKESVNKDAGFPGCGEICFNRAVP